MGKWEGGGGWALRLGKLKKEKIPYLPHFCFKGYRCPSAVLHCQWRVTWNYAYSPLKSILLLCVLTYCAFLIFICNVLFNLNQNLIRIHYTLFILYFTKYYFRNERCPTCHVYPVMNGNLRKVNPVIKNSN